MRGVFGMEPVVQMSITSIIETSIEVTVDNMVRSKSIA